MKNLAVLVAIIILFSCLVTSQVTALRSEKLEWWHYHYFYPYNYHHPNPNWPFPRAAGKAFPPLPAGYNHPFHPVPFRPPPVVTKCLSDCKEVKTCLVDIRKAFFTRKPIIGTECCASILKMDRDCDKTIFGAYHNPYFDCFVKLHCSTKSAGSTPSAPSPA